MSICVCLYSQAAIWLTAEIRSQMQGIWRFISVLSLILSLVLNDIYAGLLEGMEKVGWKASHPFFLSAFWTIQFQWSTFLEIRDFYTTR